MIVRLDCGCTIDDAYYGTMHEIGGHYPFGTGPQTFCKKCDLHKPCLCDDLGGEKAAGHWLLFAMFATVVLLLGLLIWMAACG